MRLLKRSPDGDLKLDHFNDDDDSLPPYAILSHTWLEGQEVSYHELLAPGSSSNNNNNNNSNKSKTGHAKIRFCVERAGADGLAYSWIDTCCIDKSSSQEVSTAVNSMFRWYQRAARCYVYLADVHVPAEVEVVVDDAHALPGAWVEAFRRSRWFTRGWTLQELLAPPAVEFFAEDGRWLGSRISLEREICKITGIPVDALRGRSLLEFSDEERLGWAAARKTSIREDRIYCLLGICGVFLPLIYGEGEENAALRMKEEMKKRREGRGTERVKDLTFSSSLPFPRNELFTGREDQLRSLEHALLLSPGHRRMTIYGLGGCGKSALAVEFAYRVLSRYNGRLVFWVPAITRESLELAYWEIGVRLAIPGIAEDNADIKQLVKDALNSDSANDWLMIVDNADDPEVLLKSTSSTLGRARLFDYLPYSRQGKILFTTRNRKAAGDLSPSSVLELDDMSKDEGQQLLARRISKPALLQDKVAVGKLLEILTNLPLAIVQATAFMNNNDISAAGYISLFREAGAETELFGEHFEDPSRYREMESTIAKTWHISFEQIRRQDPLAAEYLSLIACLDRVNIPLSLLPVKGSLVQQAKAIGTLKGYAFITERQQASQEPESDTFFDMHRLVHMASEWWLDGHDERTASVAEAAARLEELIPYGGHERKEVWTSYLPHAVHVARSDSGLDEMARASLLRRVGRCQESLGQYSAAEATFRQVLSLLDENLGSEHPDALTVMNNLAAMLAKQGKYKEAETMYRQQLEQSKEVLGLQHPYTLNSIHGLAKVLTRQGKYKEAEILHRQELAQSEEVLGIQHPHTRASMCELADALVRQGKYKEAEVIYRQEFAHCEKVYGLQHLDTLSSMHGLAHVMKDQGRYEEAEPMNRQILAEYTKLLGLEHPYTLASMNSLASVLMWQGKYEEAELINESDLVLHKKVLGVEHPYTLTSMNNLACILWRQGKYEEAELMDRQTLALRKKVLGPEHPDTLMSISNLAVRTPNQEQEGGIN